MNIFELILHDSTQLSVHWPPVAFFKKYHKILCVERWALSREDTQSKISPDRT